jgi:hypothetical protein
VSSERRLLIGAAVGVAVLLVGGLVVLLSGGGVGKPSRTDGITLEQFRAVPPGASQEDVEQRFGAAADRQNLETDVSASDEPQKSSCLYYPEQGRDLDEGLSFQFCFIEGKLDTKNSF